MRLRENSKVSLSTARSIQVAIVLGVLGVLLAALAPLTVSIAYQTVLLGGLFSLTLALANRLRSTEEQPRLMKLLLELSRDPEISGMHESLAEALNHIANQGDPIFRRLALQRLQTIGDQCSVIGKATIEFTSTESWRVVYEELLRSPGLHLYRSVAYIESPHYWQDGPGQQSTKLNLELQDQGIISIERTAIIADHLWPDTSLFPIEPLHSWLDEQHRHGIWIRLLRESDVGSESDLLTDFGIYGNRAIGMQSADPSGRTIRFVLSFDFEKLRQAESQWGRLAVYAISYRELLDQKH